jgi:hypothetical protein
MILRPAGDPPPPSDPRLRAVFDFLDARPDVFDWDPARAGLDVRCANVVRGVPNRARIKAFTPDANVLVLFVYKDSQVPFSDDRFSYGAALMKRGVDEAVLAAIFAFALGGLDPDQRPRDLRKTFPYTVPK